MKTHRFISLWMLVVLLLAFMCGPAMAWRGNQGGDGLPTYGTYGSTPYYSDLFSPDTATVIDLGTKGGYYNILVEQTTTYQLLFTKLSDNTSTTCKVKFDGYSTGAFNVSTTNSYPVTGSAGPWHPGADKKYVSVFGCLSSAVADRPQLTVLKQK